MTQKMRKLMPEKASSLKVYHTGPDGKHQNS